MKNEFQAGLTVNLSGKAYTVVNVSHILVNLKGGRGAKYALVKNLRHGYWTLIGKGGRVLERFATLDL